MYYLYIIFILSFLVLQLLSAESQKGVNAFQRCSFENQKGAMAIDFVQQ